MKMKALSLLVVALFTVSYSIAWERYDKCDSDYEKVGCYNDKGNDRALPKELLNERDTSSHNFDGHKIDWKKNFTAYISGLACRCAAKSRVEGYEYFGLQFYGECWSGNGNYSKHNQAEKDKCIPDYKNDCNDKDKAVCVGKQHTNYVYKLNKKIKIPDVDGGYIEWSDWTTCSKTCGNGEQRRSRTCTNPKPSGNGKDCSGLGSDKQVRSCRLQNCVPDVDGGYGTWSEWEPCSKSCGGGETKRTRLCDQPKPQGNGKDCSGLGLSLETHSCEEDICPVPCNNILDVGIVLDGSGSIKLANFAKAKKVINDLVGYLKVSPQGTHIGLIVYSTGVELKYSFLDDEHPDKVQQAFSKIRYPGGRTYTAKAIKKAGKYFFKRWHTGNRADVPDLMIVFTDGRNTDGIRKLKRALKSNNVKDVNTLAVGIGKYAYRKELLLIAHGVENNVIIAKDFDVLKKKLGSILAHSCSYGNPVVGY